MNETGTRVELFIGKGGAGKSTAACAAAHAYADAGERVLVVSIDQAHTLAEVLDVALPRDASGSAKPSPVASGLDALEIDSLALLEHRFVELSAMAVAGGHTLPVLDPSEVTGFPGVQELLALNEINRLVAQKAWDTVIVDCGPTADLVRTLGAPGMVIGYLQRLWPQSQRVAAIAGADPGRAMAAMVAERVVTAVEPVRALLSDPKRTSAYLVTGPERMALAETARIRSAAAIFGLRLTAVVVNRVLPQLGAEHDTRPADPAARWYGDRRQEQLAVIAKLAAASDGLRVVTVPHADGEPIGPRRLAGLSELGAALRESLAQSPPRSTVRLESGEGIQAVYLLRMPLPVVDPGSLRLGRVEDDLIVGADGVRGRVRLASVLRRCVVIGAELDGRELMVRFRPDPEVWPQ